METDQVSTEETEIPAEGDQGGEEEYDLFKDLNTELFGEDEDSDVSTEDESEGVEDDDDSSNQETVTVTVDGEEIEVTLDELRNGYSRQADYTKKTQALAAERERLQGMEQLAEALNTNPEVALKELAKALNVELGTPVESAEVEDDLEDLDPLERTVRELQNELKAIKGEVAMTAEQRRQAAEDAALQAEIDQIKEANSDPTLDEDALIKYAIDNKVNDLATAYRFMKLEAAETGGNKRLEEKRSAPPVEGGRTRRGAKKGSGKIESIVDAFASAMSEYNG